ncbi:MAG: heme-binding domain-containing protein [Chitinophagaceae bacterium]|nr:heme-binding domain-containing protein [Chitinophagaceae bacterium]MCB0739899.1 heme-binding domain-containing protein [Chitinophagaceae bacterium]HQV05934.1 heme-binding domain-containing protein [Chitinophagaceae bacterium]
MKYLPKSKWKKAGLIILLLIGLIQLYPRPEKNISDKASNNSITQLYQVPDSVMSILKTACYDCHSNNTKYPWYSTIQPVALFLNRHIIHGKEELNFDEFGSYTRRRQQSKFKAIANQLKDDEMPLSSYKLLHSDARLNQMQKNRIIEWTKMSIEK